MRSPAACQFLKCSERIYKGSNPFPTSFQVLCMPAGCVCSFSHSLVLITRKDAALYEALTEEYIVPCTGCGKPIATQKYCSSCGAPNPINYIDESVKVSKTRPVK